MYGTHDSSRIAIPNQMILYTWLISVLVGIDTHIHLMNKISIFSLFLYFWKWRLRQKSDQFKSPTCLHTHTYTKNDSLSRMLKRFVHNLTLPSIIYTHIFQILYSTFSSQNLSQHGRQPLQGFTCFGFLGFSQVFSSIIKLIISHPARVLGSSYAQISPKLVV